jgi:5-methylcytosine-specific restriction enzyme A
MPSIGKLNRPWVPEPEKRGNEEFYQGKLWKATRRSYIAAHPLCEECQRKGVTTEGKVVDHVVPIKQGGDLYKIQNLQTLCDRCHAIKSGKERSRY